MHRHPGTLVSLEKSRNLAATSVDHYWFEALCHVFCGAWLKHGRLGKLDIDLAPEDLEFRREVLSFLEEHLSADVRRASRLSTGVFVDPPGQKNGIRRYSGRAGLPMPGPGIRRMWLVSHAAIYL